MYMTKAVLAELGELAFIYSVSMSGEERFDVLAPSGNLRGMKIVDWDKHIAKMIVYRDELPDAKMYFLKVDFSQPEVFSITVKEIERADDLFAMAESIAKSFEMPISKEGETKEEAEKERKGEGEE
jgi:hypothetical protein